jgi:integrase/recombinase XerD
MLISQAIEEFEREHKSRGSRPKTITYYLDTLRRLLKPWLEQEVSRLTPLTINKALDRDVKPATLASQHAVLRCFCNWLVAVEELQKNPFQGKKRPKIRLEPKRVLSINEMTKMLDAAKGGQRSARCKSRNIALLVLIFDTGLRAGEVASLKLSSIDWEMGVVRVEDGKVGVRFVTVGHKTLRVLKRYVTHERRGSSQSLFLTISRKPLSSRQISQLILRISQRSDIGWEVRAHRLRHSYSCAYLRSGGEVFSLMRQLGHKRLDTTARYIHWTPESLQEANERFSPMASLASSL